MSGVGPVEYLLEAFTPFRLALPTDAMLGHHDGQWGEHNSRLSMH